MEINPNFREVLVSAMNGCCHEFHIADLMQVERGTIIACKGCGEEATAGEVAWMLAGGHVVKIHCDMLAQAKEQLSELAESPGLGGVH